LFDPWSPFLQDGVLFESIISDLFPAAAPPALRAGELRRALAAALLSRGLQAAEGLVVKAVQLRETLGVRFGVMIVGQAGGVTHACPLDAEWG
jgi:dynein heavy chain